MTDRADHEWSGELVKKAGKLLACHQRVDRDGRHSEHLYLVLAAVSIFGNMSIKEATDFMRANRVSIEQIAFQIDAGIDIQDLPELG